jgi:putative heme-binding domain-containing protein
VSEVLQTIDADLKSGKDQTAFSLAQSLREGLRLGGSQTGSAGGFDKVLARAKAAAADSSASPAMRIEAIRLLGTTTFDDSSSTLVPLLDAPQTQEIRLATVEALDHFTASKIASELISRFVAFPPPVRSAAIAALLRRPDRIIAMLQAMQSGKMHPSDLTTAQANSLRKHRNPAVRDLAIKLLPASSPRDGIIQRFQPALALTGNAEHGHLIYQQRCAQCHRLGGEGFAVGPDLTTIRNDGKPKALVNIIDPNREVAPNYVAYLVETKTGESVLGLLAGETATSVTVRQPFGKENVIPRSDITRLESQKLSLMAEGLEEGLSPQDFADLLEFVFTVR